MAVEPLRGGPANLRGVHYQLVRSLFQATQVLGLTELDHEAGERYVLVLEPHGGGDLRLEAIRFLEVEQTKIRRKRTWSLSEVIHEVLPDLYRAFKENRHRLPVRESRFVTDGRQGQWRAAQEFFQELEGREYDPEWLDDVNALKVNAPAIARELNQAGRRLTKRGLFGYLARALIGSDDPEPAQERTVWDFLGTFRLQSVNEEDLEKEVVARLRSRVARSEEVPIVVRALVGTLLKRGGSGETVVPNELFASYGLADISLADRMTLVSRGRKELATTLSQLGYNTKQDVRRSHWQERPSPLPGKPMKPLVLYGESGQGKSWSLYARAKSLAQQGRLVILIQAGADRASIAQRAARAFCHPIWGIDGEIPLERLHERLLEADPANAGDWLDLLVDGVTTLELAVELASYDWGARGIRLCFCLTTAGASEERQLRSQCTLKKVVEFSTRELHDYLQIRLGARGRGVAYSERSILRRPLLARIFCDLTHEVGSPPPENEFHLLANYWTRVVRERPLAAGALSELAAEEPGGRAYPWTMRTLRESGMEEPAVLYLARRGLLRWSQDGRSAELWHDRVLSWLMAEGWATMVRDGRLTLEELGARLGALRDPSGADGRWGRRWVGDALLDVLWLLLGVEAGSEKRVAQLLKGLRPEPRPEVLACLGERAVPILFLLILERPERSLLWVQTLKLIDSPEVPGRSCNLLGSDNLKARLAAAEVLADCPTQNALDGLWDLRCELEREEPRNLNAIYGTVEKALAVCVRHADDWMRRRIRVADPSAEPVEALVYLLPRMDHGDRLWAETKEIIFSKVTPEHERCIAVCLESFQDRQHNDWLQERTGREDAVAPAARRALFLLEPGRPPDPVEGEGRWITLGRGWWLLPHLNADAERTAEFIHEQVAHSEDPWQVAWSLLSGFENRISSETLDLLLDAAAEVLAAELAGPSEEDGARLWAPFSFLAKVTSLHLVERFEARRGSQLEDDLSEWLRRQGVNDDRLGRPSETRALAILERIGGDGLTRVINSWLEQANTYWGLREVIEFSLLRPDERTAELLLEVVHRDQVEGSEFPLNQRDATVCLAVIGRRDLAVQGLMKWSTKLSWQQVGLFTEHRMDVADLRPALDAVEAFGSPDPDVVFTVGLGQMQSYVPVIHEILKSARKGSEPARSCLLALYVMGDESPATQQAFLEHLGHAETEYVCVLGLLKVPTTETLEALKVRLSELRKERLSSSDVAVLIAVNLLVIEETQLDVAKLLWDTLDPQRLLFVVQDELSPFADLERLDVDEWLYGLALGEEGYLEPGARVGAIRALGRRDPQRAFEAVERLMEHDSPDREEGPRLLLELDSVRALPLLKKHLGKDGHVPLVVIIGEELFSTGNLETLLEWFQDPSPSVREGACVAAESLPWRDELARHLRTLLYDGDWEVRNAANQALDQIWHTREAEGLIEVSLSETDISRRWRLLDIALEAGHPGLSRHPAWLTMPWKQLSTPMRSRVRERLENRRKNLRQKLKRRSRRVEE